MSNDYRTWGLLRSALKAPCPDVSGGVVFKRDYRPIDALTDCDFLDTKNPGSRAIWRPAQSEIEGSFFRQESPLSSLSWYVKSNRMWSSPLLLPH